MENFRLAFYWHGFKIEVNGLESKRFVRYREIRKWPQTRSRRHLFLFA